MQCVNENVTELVRNLVAHGDAREGKWRGNWRMEWVASTLTPPPSVVYPSLLKPMRKPRLPAVDWTDARTDLNGLVRFGERRILVSARVPSRSARVIPLLELAMCFLDCFEYACTVHNTHATQVILRCHSTDNVCTTSISTLNQVCNFS